MQIGAYCAICGDLKLAPGQITLIGYGTALPKFCVFRCPNCDALLRANLTPQLVRDLRNVHVRETRLDASLPAGPPLGLDDLIDLGLEMEDL